MGKIRKGDERKKNFKKQIVQSLEIRKKITI